MLISRLFCQSGEHDCAPEDHRSEQPSWLPEACTPELPIPVPALPPKQFAGAGKAATDHVRVPTVQSGDCVGDFRILERLGSGAFATVYLAEQLPLGRRVALKVSTLGCSEAQLLATLEHDHIVQVFSQTEVPGQGWQLLCMQYVDGLSLDELCRKLWRSAEDWTGRDLLQVLGETPLPDGLTSSAAGGPAVPPEATRAECVCLLGGWLADALGHAHNRGILHRDIKPANILVDRSGSPRLADFNLSYHLNDPLADSSQLFGGSIAYMAPEHLDAFNPEDPTGQDVVDTRADIYSLGVVLLELATGKRPWSTAGRDIREPATLRDLAGERRAMAVPLRQLCSTLPAPLAGVLRRCMAADPARRYQSANELTKALRGACDVLQMQRTVPRQDIWSAVRVRPFVLMWVALLLPHIVGSVTNITYNGIYIVGLLSAAQQRVFIRLVLGYNLIAYGAALAFILAQIVPVCRAWRNRHHAADWPPGEMGRIRLRVLSWPNWSIRVSLLAWLPGAILFPAAISWETQMLPLPVFCHFAVSFGVSCLIGLTYTCLGVQFVTLELLYPWLWLETWSPHQTARHELNDVTARLKRLQVLSGTVPLAAAVMLLASTPERLGLDSRLMISGLIIAGSLGFVFALAVAGRLQRMVTDLMQPAASTGI